MRTLGLRPSDKTSLFKVLLAIIVLVAIIRIVDIDRILEAASSANGWFILAGVLLLPVNLILENLLWYRLVIASTNTKIRFGRAFGSLLLGHSLSIFTPARAGELVGRPLYLGLANKWQTGIMVATHRIIDLTCVVVMGTVCLILFRMWVDVPYGHVWLVFTVVGGALSILMMAILLLPGHTHRWLSKFLKTERLRDHIAFLLQLNTRTTTVLLSLAWLRYFVYTAQFLILIYAFAPQAPATLGYMAVALVMFAKFITPPVTFTDLGVREGASVFFFGLIAVDAASAFNASILVYVTNLLIPSCLGLPFVFGLRATKKNGSNSLHPAADQIVGGENRNEQPSPALAGSYKTDPVHPTDSGFIRLSRGEK